MKTIQNIFTQSKTAVRFQECVCTILIRSTIPKEREDSLNIKILLLKRKLTAKSIFALGCSKGMDDTICVFVISSHSPAKLLDASDLKHSSIL